MTLQFVSDIEYRMGAVGGRLVDSLVASYGVGLSSSSSSSSSPRIVVTAPGGGGTLQSPVTSTTSTQPQQQQLQQGASSSFAPLLSSGKSEMGSPLSSVGALGASSQRKRADPTRRIKFRDEDEDHNNKQRAENSNSNINSNSNNNTSSPVSDVSADGKKQPPRRYKAPTVGTNSNSKSDHDGGGRDSSSSLNADRQRRPPGSTLAAFSYPPDQGFEDEDFSAVHRHFFGASCATAAGNRHSRHIRPPQSTLTFHHHHHHHPHLRDQHSSVRGDCDSERQHQQRLDNGGSLFPESHPLRFRRLIPAPSFSSVRKLPHRRCDRENNDDEQKEEDDDGDENEKNEGADDNGIQRNNDDGDESETTTMMLEPIINELECRERHPFDVALEKFNSELKLRHLMSGISLERLFSDPHDDRNLRVVTTTPSFSFVPQRWSSNNNNNNGLYSFHQQHPPPSPNSSLAERLKNVRSLDEQQQQLSMEKLVHGVAEVVCDYYVIPAENNKDPRNNYLSKLQSSLMSVVNGFRNEALTTSPAAVRATASVELEKQLVEYFENVEKQKRLALADALASGSSSNINNNTNTVNRQQHQQPQTAVRSLTLTMSAGGFFNSNPSASARQANEQVSTNNNKNVVASSLTTTSASTATAAASSSVDTQQQQQLLPPQQLSRDGKPFSQLILGKQPVFDTAFSPPPLQRLELVHEADHVARKLAEIVMAGIVDLCGTCPSNTVCDRLAGTVERGFEALQRFVEQPQLMFGKNISAEDHRAIRLRFRRLSRLRLLREALTLMDRALAATSGNNRSGNNNNSPHTDNNNQWASVGDVIFSASQTLLENMPDIAEFGTGRLSFEQKLDMPVPGGQRGPIAVLIKLLAKASLLEPKSKNDETFQALPSESVSATGSRKGSQLKKLTAKKQSNDSDD